MAKFFRYLLAIVAGVCLFLFIVDTREVNSYLMDSVSSVMTDSIITYQYKAHVYQDGRVYHICTVNDSLYIVNESGDVNLIQF